MTDLRKPSARRVPRHSQARSPGPRTGKSHGSRHCGCSGFLPLAKRKRNAVLVGLTGVGKTSVSSALVLKACEQGFSARCFRAPKLPHDLEIASADGAYKNKLDSLARIDLVIFDDWLIAPLQNAHRRDLLEILDDRYDTRSTMIASQLPVELWHQAIGDPTLADAILDPFVHNAYRSEPKGESLRKAKGLQTGGILDPVSELLGETYICPRQVSALNALWCPDNLRLGVRITRALVSAFARMRRCPL